MGARLLTRYLFERLAELGIEPEQVVGEYAETRGAKLASENRLRRVLNKRYRLGLELRVQPPPRRQGRPTWEEEDRYGNGE